MSNESEVLAANRAFYSAFAARDCAAMERVWATRSRVACIHPGWDALHERKPVIDSWRRILANPGAPAIVCRDEKAFVAGDVAFVVCQEVLDSGILVATNIFIREEGAWKMIHHHAGPVALLATAEPKGKPAVH